MTKKFTLYLLLFLALAITIYLLLIKKNSNVTLKSPFVKNALQQPKDSLASSPWFFKATQYLQQQEYYFTKKENTEEFFTNNPTQQLSFSIQPNFLKVTPYNNKNWYVNFQQLNNKEAQNQFVQQNTLSLINNQVETNYTNTSKGLRQDFIVKQKPEKNKLLTIQLGVNTNINYEVMPQSINFSNQNQLVYQYNGLKVWDALQTPLAAQFIEQDDSTIAIVVQDENAVYPVTVDPLSSTPNTQLDDGDQAFARFGYAISSAGDVNGDGYSDVIIGAYFKSNLAISSNNQRGYAYIYHGSATGLSTTPARTLVGTQNNAWFGWAVTTAGDVNGDGYSDVAISAKDYDVTNPSTQSGEGRVYVYHGSATGIGATANTTIDGQAPATALGYSLACGGDANNNGFSELLIGNTSDEAVHIHYGTATGVNTTPTIITNPTPGGFSTSIGCAGDVNGDGFSDMIVGAPYTDDGANSFEGRAYVYNGSATGFVTTPSVTINHINVSDAEFGTSVAGAGDVNGDGYSDVIIGAPFMQDGANVGEGLAYIHYGSAAGTVPTPATTIDDADQAGALLGYAVASAGDINGDGYADIIVGAYSYNDGANANEGRTLVYYGGVTGITANPISTQDGGSQTDMLFGQAVASAGDVNGDGYSDVLIGAPQYTGDNSQEGNAFIYHGTPYGLATSVGLTFNNNPQANAEKGYFVNSAGDVNADGYSDVLVSARAFDDNFTDEGVVYVYHGTPTGFSATPTYTLDDANQATARFGISASFAGDVNGDGYGDVIVGASNYDAGNTDEGAAFIYHGSASGLGASPAVIIDGANQNTAAFGWSVACAGDVNGDGFSDVAVGAYNYDVPNGGNTGRVFYYYGSTAGITNTPAAFTQLPNDVATSAPQAGANYGISVAGAGDVNGDGYSDVIVGAWNYDIAGVNFNEGLALVYHGSASGINTTASATLDDCVEPNGFLGYMVNVAGDVNGDGYSDIIVGAYGAEVSGNIQVGEVFVYHGSATGVNTTPANTIRDATNASALFGVSVSSAGDINGDGYSDVIIGASQYTGDVSLEGGAFIYFGSPTGIPSTANLILQDGNQGSGRYGFKAASAGDVNGDGYSDIIVGANLYDDGVTNSGSAFLYYGNNRLQNRRNNLRLYNSDLVTPLQQSNMADPNLFGLGLYQKSPFGRDNGRLTWQTIQNGNAFSGNPITNSTAYSGRQSTFSNLGLDGVELKSQVPKIVGAKFIAIRARTEFAKAKAFTGQVYSPWRYPEYYLRGRRDIGAVVLPVKFTAFNATKNENTSILSWKTTEETPNVYYIIEHSVDGINFQPLSTVNAKFQSFNDYNYTHLQPKNGKNYYRIKAIVNSKVAYTAIKQLFFNQPVISVYPTVVKAGATITIQTPAINNTNNQYTLTIYSNQGQLVLNQKINLQSVQQFSIPNTLVSGSYFIALFQNNSRVHQQQIIVQ